MFNQSWCGIIVIILGLVASVLRFITLSTDCNRWYWTENTYGGGGVWCDISLSVCGVCGVLAWQTNKVHVRYITNFVWRTITVIADHNGTGSCCLGVWGTSFHHVAADCCFDSYGRAAQGY